MAEPTNGNGSNGNRVRLLERVKAGVKEDVTSLKTDIPAKAKEQVDLLKDPTKTQVYTSIFRHKHDDTPRNRALGVLSNVFLHLHPAKINRDAVRYSYTWGMARSSSRPVAAWRAIPSVKATRCKAEHSPLI